MKAKTRRPSSPFCVGGTDISLKKSTHGKESMMQAASAFILYNGWKKRQIPRLDDARNSTQIDGITGIAKWECFPTAALSGITTKSIQNQIYTAQCHPSFVPTPIPSCPEHAVIFASPVNIRESCNPHFYGLKDSPNLPLLKLGLDLQKSNLIGMDRIVKGCITCTNYKDLLPQIWLWRESHDRAPCSFSSWLGHVADAVAVDAS